MIMFKMFSRAAALCILLACSLSAQADDLQDANKLFKQGLHAQAMEKVDALLAAKPKDAAARFLKGLIFTEQGNTADAITTFTNLTEDYPELPEPYNNLAVLYAGQGNYEKAKSSLEMAIRTNPNYATAHENLGDIYAKMASQSYDHALKLDKNNATTRIKLTLIRELFSKSARAAGKRSSVPATEVAAPVDAAVTRRSADPATEVLKATQEWAAAWSARNSKKYLAFYAKEFKTPAGESRSAWESQRKARIAAPKSIRVEVLEAEVKVADDQHASVSFKQTYRASRLNSTSSKTLDWVKVDGQWLIAEERSDK
jgi:tetratricopeptide (TPR) repeat protein